MCLSCQHYRDLASAGLPYLAGLIQPQKREKSRFSCCLANTISLVPCSGLGSQSWKENSCGSQSPRTEHRDEPDPMLQASPELSQSLLATILQAVGPI